jgi:hypothetical protein
VIDSPAAAKPARTTPPCPPVNPLNVPDINVEETEKSSKAPLPCILLVATWTVASAPAPTPNPTAKAYKTGHIGQRPSGSVKLTGLFHA